MGYRTYHTLDVIDVSEETKLKIIADLRETYADAEYSLEENGQASNETKWYDHEEQMLEFSKKYPDILIQLDGIGEDSDDIWTQYFKNGKTQFCQAEIVLPPFNADELK